MQHKSPQTETINKGVGYDSGKKANPIIEINPTGNNQRKNAQDAALAEAMASMIGFSVL